MRGRAMGWRWERSITRFWLRKGMRVAGLLLLLFLREEVRVLERERELVLVLEREREQALVLVPARALVPEQEQELLRSTVSAVV